MRWSIAIVAALAAETVTSLPSDPANIQKRQKTFSIPASLITMVNGFINPHGGKAPEMSSSAALIEEMPPRAKVDGSKTIKVRYGPYRVPNMNKKNLLGDEGSLWNYGDVNVKKPCEKCMIIGMKAGLEYTNGTNANIDTGLWLHHMVLVNSGPGRSDATCDFLPFTGPHAITGSFPRTSERIFASGNERTTFTLPSWGLNKVGYKLNPDDTFGLIIDLMNENMEDKYVYMTMTYDIVPGHPDDYAHMRPVWFDVAQCLTSEWPAPYNAGNYSVPSMTWKANFEGEVLGAIGHLHDGGQRVTLDVGGKRVCSSDAQYGTEPEYVQKTPMANPKSATEHISLMSVCVNDSMGVKKMTTGQKWILRAEYDYEKNKGVLHHDGKQDNVMGIAIMYVKVADGEKS